MHIAHNQCQDDQAEKEKLYQETMKFIHTYMPLIEHVIASYLKSEFIADHSFTEEEEENMANVAFGVIKALANGGKYGFGRELKFEYKGVL